MSKIFSLGFSVSVKCVILVSPGDLGPRRTGDTVGQVLLQAKFYCWDPEKFSCRPRFPAGQVLLQGSGEKRKKKKESI